MVVKARKDTLSGAVAGSDCNMPLSVWIAGTCS